MFTHNVEKKIKKLIQLNNQLCFFGDVRVP